MVINVINGIYLLPFKLPLCWLHSLTPVIELSMLLGIRSLAVAMHLEIYWVYVFNQYHVEMIRIIKIKPFIC